MLTAYLDDSGTHAESAVVTLAGYAGSVSAWARFEIEAAKVFDAYGVRLLHTKDFHDRKNEFARWSRLKKNSFVVELYDAAGELSLGLSLSAHKQNYNLGKPVFDIAHNTSPIGFCLLRIIDWLLRDPRVKDAVWSDGLAIVIESGNKNDRDLERVFHVVRQEHMLQDVLKAISFVDKSSSISIQLADFLAFYSRRHAEACERAGVHVTPPAPIGIASRAIPHLGHVAIEFFP
jgi:hypothetical protein